MGAEGGEKLSSENMSLKHISPQTIFSIVIFLQSIILHIFSMLPFYLC